MMTRMLVCAAMAAACLSVPGCGGGSSSPGAVAKGFFQALADGDAEKAKQYIAPGDLKGPEVNMAMTMMVTKVSTMAKEKKGITDIEVVKETVDGDKAKVDLKLTFGDGTTETADGMEVKKVDGKWYVDMSDN